MTVSDLKEYLYYLQMDPQLSAEPFVCDEVFSTEDTECDLFEKIDVINKILKCMKEYQEQTQTTLVDLKKTITAMSFYKRMNNGE